MRKICVITGTRAEYGILSHLMQLIQSSTTLKLQIIATNMHLSPQFGLTYKEIENDGFFIDKKVQMLLSADTANATVKSVGLATIGFADAFEELQPDLILILGDRYEMLATATAALLYKIPVAHLHGGEITEGAYDDAIRHAITKLSHLHFTSTEEYRKRVIQLGENPDRVFNVGALGVENVLNTPLMRKTELETSMSFNLGEKCLLVTFHPVTLESSSSLKQFQDLLAVLEEYTDYKIVFTMPNSDTEGHSIMTLIDDFVQNHNNSISYTSLGKLRYLSLLQFVDAVVGNSSSGIIEVPSMGIPTLNIGNRQKGRIQGAGIINCEPDYASIKEGMTKVLSPEIKEIAKKRINPYMKEGTSSTILNILQEINLDRMVNKTFYDLRE
ncbi:MAG: UDP-N-acetylglucosamine 2-epimerase [Prevotella sp.]|jgi:UDP-N-acetylglucosamine 2-epimerase (non-hydrolysing)/GDP/UDP-N,N'-diacetylbacillosamine 2-epimerase (hydrolysing)|nr:UDP-N-acetylglucosamine 2-epimerase [Prevotella sp.]